MKHYVQLKSDNYDNAILTKDAYKTLRLQMSTGDFHSHKAKNVRLSVEPDNLVTIGEVLGLARWSRPDNFIGTDFSDYFTGFSQTRDSCVLEQSNFAVALDRLGGESKTVVVAHFGHWACGWVEQIMVHKSDTKALEILSELKQSYDSYPVLDDSDHSERENEYYSNCADSEKESVASVLVQLFGLPEEFKTSKEMLSLAYELNMEAQYYGGGGDCVYSNEFYVDSMDERDISELEDCVERLIGNGHLDSNPAFQLICACFGLEVVS